ncbi:unnamed protein product [Diabrotica balteata]|uniref:Major facilitator superfamily (MFS) profile domain-containing protein n=1 Tax=Diabrotica balteata TaxID=107213 RepID=A0A9N9XA02_DIABA|nr:unnamed protein product [Diabrotica balteata]
MVYVTDKNIEATVSCKNEEIESESHHPPVWLFWKARRYIVTILVFFGLFCDYALRVNMSVAIVAMTQYENVTLENGTTVLQRDFDWDTAIQGHILSSFYYGYLLTQVIGGYLSTQFGGKPVFAVGIGGVSILNLLTPLLSRVNGMLFPCANEVFAKWAPSLEKGRLVTIGFSGCYAGTLACLPISSMLAAYLGWESVFYAFGNFHF